MKTTLTIKEIKKIIENNGMDYLFKNLKNMVDDFEIEMYDINGEIIWEKHFGEKEKYWAYNELESELRECKPLIFWSMFEKELPDSRGCVKIPINKKRSEWIEVYWDWEEEYYEIKESSWEEEKKELLQDKLLEEIWKDYDWYE